MGTRVVSERKASVNTKSSYALRLLILLHWITLATLSLMGPPGGGKPALIIGFLIFYIPMALICVSVFIDWVTPREASRRYAKLIDSSIWVLWVFSMGYLVLYSLQMGTL
jgi:hypothetical protein